MAFGLMVAHDRPAVSLEQREHPGSWSKDAAWLKQPPSVLLPAYQVFGCLFDQGDDILSADGHDFRYLGAFSLMT
jgi:hypothetical protein